MLNRTRAYITDLLNDSRSQVSRSFCGTFAMSTEKSHFVLVLTNLNGFSLCLKLKRTLFLPGSRHNLKNNSTSFLNQSLGFSLWKSTFLYSFFAFRRRNRESLIQAIKQSLFFRLYFRLIVSVFSSFRKWQSKFDENFLRGMATSWDQVMPP